MIQTVAKITQHTEVAPRHFRLRFAAPSIAEVAQAGQFVHVLPRSYKSLDPLLRRAFSILSTQEDTVDILYRVEGRGTGQMAQFHTGDAVDVLGPLGRAFTPSRRAILVGGGVGVPPLAMLATQQCNATLSTSHHPEVMEGTDQSAPQDVVALSSIPAHAPQTSNCTQWKSPHIEALIGARTRDELICLDIFAACHVPVQVATDDGSAGFHGFVTELLEQRLRQLATTNALPDEDSPTVYACGPLAMLRAVAALCATFKVPCQVSLEENMPCGVGVCNGCVVRAAEAGDDYGRYKRICVDGPVMWAHEISW
jgi:dihydroorotate dehydrogenase electron transfer subunit